MNTREFTKEDGLFDMLDDAVEIESQPWRHGRKVRYVFEHDGCHWAVWVNVHHEEGVDIDHPITATKVHQVERTVKRWEPIAP